MRELLVFSHLGLGDGLVANGLVRRLAESRIITFLCKPHNGSSLSFMWRDELNITLMETEDDREAAAICDHIASKNKDVMRLGMHSAKPFDARRWDREIYRQAGINFQERWNNFRVNRQPSTEVKAPDKPFIFVHEDRPRGFMIDAAKLPKDIQQVRPDPKQAENIFSWWDCIEKAQEIHCIDSSFAILADSLPDLQAVRMLIHLYARPGALPPSYTKPMWEILK